jgi:signal transduction histidine kinase
VKRPSLRNLGKYLLHGVAFAALLFILTLFSRPILALLAVIGSFLGIIIGFVILLLLVGVINSFITETLWFRMETSWKKYLYQGILLLIILGMVGLPLQYLYSLSTSLKLVSRVLTGAVLFLAGSLIYGYIGKRVGSIWLLREPLSPSTHRAPTIQTRTPPPQVDPAKPVETKVTPIAPGSPEELKREEARLELLVKQRQRADLLNPEILDNLIETQKRTVEALRKALAGKNP